MEDFVCVWLILITVPVVPLFAPSALFTEPRVGKERVKRLEENARSSRKCRCIYSLLAAAAATGITQHNHTQHFRAFPRWSLYMTCMT